MVEMGYLKKDNETMVCAAQEQTLLAKLRKYHIDGNDVSPKCMLFGESKETVMHLSSGCPVLANSKYRIRLNTMRKHIHWLLLMKYGIAAGNKCYSHVCTQCFNRKR